jgi:HEPN domain-containing protein
MADSQPPASQWDPDGPTQSRETSQLERLHSVAGEAVKTIRDKVIAHRERIDENALPRATYAQIEELVEFAKDVTTAVGHGYTGVGYRTDSDEYHLTSDAERALRSLKRLLAAAGVALKPNEPVP